MLEDFKIGDDKIEPPDVYLGATLAKMKLDSVKGTYIYQIGWPIHQDDGSTKKIGINEQIYILRGELEYVVFYFSEGLPQEIDLLVSEITNLEC